MSAENLEAEIDDFLKNLETTPRKKKKKVAPKKPAEERKVIPLPKEVYAVFFIKEITCTSCNMVHKFCTGQGIKEVYSKKTITSRLSEFDKSDFLAALKADKKENFVTSEEVKNCSNCSDFLK